MPAAVRLSDICSGHSDWPSRPSGSASSNVYANNLGAHRVGDLWLVHCDPYNCHDSILGSGCPTVYCNNLQWGMIGSTVVCGSICAEGSPNTFLT